MMKLTEPETLSRYEDYQKAEQEKARFVQFESSARINREFLPSYQMPRL
ncbi:MAG: hypothetical protein BWY98_01117 [Tenericutes bacterium ADurb.BinA155]|jgi:hypothetical protein|nr:MAG: hypothetical protein BWY98_01117 [Tenericutes bacterium ADurb.BinA155]